MRGRHIGKWAAILFEPAAFIVYALLAVVFSDLCRDRNLASIYKQQQLFFLFQPARNLPMGFSAALLATQSKGFAAAMTLQSLVLSDGNFEVSDFSQATALM
ncbi:MAG: hypothetical protein LCH86_23965 [Proteobacteria bacterium]|nr:hypothetical protein [Pseudomonadota bacterium]